MDQDITATGMVLLALDDGRVQIGSYVFDADDADKITGFLAGAKKLRADIAKSKKAD